MNCELLTIEEIKQKYPDEWLLLIDCRLSKNTELKSGKVVVHSKCRDDIHKALKNYSGRLAIHYAGEIPDNLVVIF